MSTLARYIARLYAVNALTLFLILFSLVIGVDAMINLGRFSNRAVQIAGDGPIGTLHHVLLTGLLVVDLWGPRLLQLFTHLNGMVLITAMGFTCVQLVRHREFVAMLSSGIGLHRAARPFLAVTVAMFLLQAAVQEFALPRVAHLLLRDPGDAGKRELNTFAVRMAPDGFNRLWYARRFDDAADRLEDLVVWERDAGGRLLRTVAAAHAQWDGAGWRLEGGLGRAPAPADEAAPLRPERIDRIDTDLDPERLKVRHLKGFASTLSLRQIGTLLRASEGDGVDERSRQRLELARWGRLSGLLCGLAAFWGALSIFLVKAPRPMIMPALKASAVALGGFAAAAVASGALIPGLPVWFSALVPFLVLLSVAVALATGVET